MLYSTLYRKYGFPLLQTLLRRPTMRMVSDLRKSERLDGKLIRERQLKALDQLVRHARKNIPFYSEAYSRLSFEGIESFEQFSTLPVLDRQDVSRNFRAMVANGVPISSIFLSRTGGSSGEPLSFYALSHSAPLGLALMIRARAWWGIGFNERNAVFIEHGLKFEEGWRSGLARALHSVREKALNRRFFSAYRMAPSDMQCYYDEMMRFRPVYLIGYASFLYLFAKFMADKQINAEPLGVRCIFYTSEMLYPWQRVVIEQVFGCPVVAEYGLKEVGVVAYECPSRRIHTMDESVYVEVMPLKENPKYGEVLVTQLQMNGAPFIRYRTGDLAAVVDPDAVCDCGRGLHLMGAIEGRSHDWIMTPSGKTIHGQIFTHALIVGGGVDKFRVLQRGDYSIRIEAQVNVSFSDETELMIIARLREIIGEPLPISIHKVSSIPVENSGKFRWIRSEIGVYDRSLRDGS